MGRNAARAGREVLRFRLPLGTPLARAPRAPLVNSRTVGDVQAVGYRLG